MDKPKTIIFDFGGVLVNDRSSDKFLADAISKVPTNHQKAYEKIRLQSELGQVPYSKLLETDKLIFPDKSIEEIKDFFLNTEVYEPFRIAEKLLKTNPVIIFSNNHAGAPEETAKMLKINIAQFTFINSAYVGMRKPNKEFYDYMVKTFHLIPKECIFIDNTFHNLIPAQELGMTIFHYKRNDEELTRFLKNEGLLI